MSSCFPRKPRFSGAAKGSEHMTVLRKRQSRNWQGV